MAFDYRETLTPKESILLDKESEENRLSREHAVRLKQLDIAYKKEELKLRRLDAQKARQHAETMKELEYAIKYQETRFRSLLRLPTAIIKLPAYIILAIGATIHLVKEKEIPNNILELFK